jgi:nitrate reductase NapE component
MGDWIHLLKALRPKGCLFDRVEVTASDNRRERIEVMTITDWIIQLSIFGVLALAVVGTVQNLVDALRKKG